LKKFTFPKFSIFFKLILVVILFGVLLDVGFLLSIRFSTDVNLRREITSGRFETALIEQMGNPPDTAKATLICRDMQWDMRYQSHSFNWTTSENMPKVEDLIQDPDFKEKFFSKDERVGTRFNGRFYYVHKTPKGYYIIQPPILPEPFNTEKALIIIFVLVTVIIFLLYLVLRWLFKPLKVLTAAVEEVGEGNYNIEIPVKRNDELGDLANSITQMSSKIGNSIKSKEQLMLDVSHELRTPLTRIKLGLEVDSSKDKINEDVIEMERMISSLLENYRSDSIYDSIDTVRTDAAELLDDTVSEYEADNRIKYTKPAKEYFINIDPDKIQVVFRNVIDNALKYSPGDVVINIKESKGTVDISFADKGVGISEEDRKYIFEPFYRADRSRSRKTGGFGLGLSISKKIMDAHKAEITFRSKLNEGTTVTLSFRK
jgi:signal transduction histidine kinase